MDGMERMPVNTLEIPYLFRTVVNAVERGFYSYSGSQIIFGDFDRFTEIELFPFPLGNLPIKWSPN